MRKCISLCAALIFFLFTGFFASCKSTEISFPDTDSVTLPPPSIMTKLPLIEYSGIGIKYEVESMLLYQYIVFADATASGQYGAKLLDESSTAHVQVYFAEPGTYECMLCQRSLTGKCEPFYVYLDNVPYRVYASDPPTGEWELTSRTPIYFTVEEPRTVLFTIQANSETRLGTTGVNLDYIQFVKRY